MDCVWVVRFPDLILIEHIWDDLGRKIATRFSPPTIIQYCPTSRRKKENCNSFLPSHNHPVLSYRQEKEGKLQLVSPLPQSSNTVLPPGERKKIATRLFPPTIFRYCPTARRKKENWNSSNTVQHKQGCFK
ncbi:hypothetical protein AVEN_72686-1 [Araneus ventricosus]|uniref:Uncharacterized protein n=1 Tax=Araneus ventricosus TaxID=182803 RepID=A0A4Y2V1T8_ARAVE|nr:hypothetical protein AVEN_72686-1 [Araneus ventricosus]